MVNTPASLIRTARLSAGLTQVQLAARLGMSQPEIARLERPSANPTVRTLDRVVQGAGCKLVFEVEQRSIGLDESQLLASLSLSPAQRLARFTVALQNMNQLRSGARRVVR
jgi:transcriptional regulator with XRE-family HTH domain